MRTLLPLWILFFQFITAVVASATTTLPTDEHGDYNGLDLIEWIKSHPDGDIHPSLRIGRERPGDPTSINGLFVASSPSSKPIEKGDVIAQIPWECLIHPDGKYSTSKYFSCRAIYNLAKELKLGDKSERAPYVRYLLTQPRGSMPGEWSTAAQNFFSDMLGRDELPPYEHTWRTIFETEWIEGCSGSTDEYYEMERVAYWLASSRDEDTLMVPVYDMANHSNDPNKLNTLSYKPDKAGDSFRLVASKKILPGEQIYNSYNRCNQCSDVDAKDCETYSFWRTPDLFVRFGFVEDYPQNWEFDPTTDDHNDDSSDDDSSDDDDREFDVCLQREEGTGEVVALWGEDDEEDLPDGQDIQWLGMHYKRLQKLQDDKETLEKELVRGEGVDDNGENKMTRGEWESIWKYHEALVQAIDTAILSSNIEEDSDDSEDSGDDSRDEL